ncbi:conserved oligomeric Golgi complex subunit 2-like isoform X2 [Mustela lutreola]|uniref:conserved oligomeric Golgi complex subunit 2-like isoform X2 n=1 Tax=Mustela lutreola TaxID=9666 RepID=UPI0027975265|nr:conserved oligomeric Golgi complex subunit 2-like isoform X2 [Mustela lutreola]
MVELINKDYADFVNLSTNLSLRSPVSEGIRAVDKRMCKQEDIRKKKVIVEQIVESHPDGLKIMYANKLLEFVPHHCRLLREVTGGAISRKTLLRYALPVRVTVSSATWTRFGNVLHINVSKCLLY